MRYRYLSDNHCHTDCSFDGVDPAMMLCDSATRQGLFALTITDHCECHRYYDEGYNRAIRQSYFEARKAAAVFRGTLHVYAGIELGQPMQDLKAAEEALSMCDYDFVLGSLHNVSGQPDFYDISYETADLPALLHTYFDEMLAMVQWGGFDSLAHMTYPWRYAQGDHGIALSYDPYWEQIDAVLKALIDKGLSLELNTSGLRQKLGTTIPDEPILRRYRELGGKRVTIGSDAHRWADVASGVEDGLALLESLGFTHIAIYHAHVPDMYPIA